MANFRRTGALSLAELGGQLPPLDRLREGPCAVIECVEEIPCNPCEQACPVGAISVGPDITSTPRLDFQRCTGCGACLGVCPGLAIFLLDLAGDTAKITVPHELLPVPQPGDEVELLSRKGECLGTGKTLRTRKTGTTWIVTVELPAEELLWEVRAIRRSQ
ncbi:MAG TPA: 4Fe-4S dicluster domain-containing protein [Candidatus Acetothermia bacterium]|nr:4Fe-4S dicluster domain-containing protein [Candidatus Acetothermia bacterium]